MNFVFLLDLRETPPRTRAGENDFIRRQCPVSILTKEVTGTTLRVVGESPDGIDTHRMHTPRLATLIALVAHLDSEHPPSKREVVRSKLTWGTTNTPLLQFNSLDRLTAKMAGLHPADRGSSPRRDIRHANTGVFAPVAQW